MKLISVADIFRAKIVDVDKESLMIELTGNQSKLEALLNLLMDMRSWNLQEQELQDWPEEAKMLHILTRRI